MKSGNVQAKDIQAKIMQVKNVQAKDVQVEDAQLKSMQAQDVQSKNMQTEDMQLQNADGGYLSDEELELLIADVEQNDLVAAPPDMAEDIWNIICTSDIADHKAVSKDKVREFRAYCFRVVGSVAAAVVLVFTVPTFLGGQESYCQNEEMSQRAAEQSEYESREELLGRSSLTEFLSRNSIFGSSIRSDNDREWNIFK